MISGRAVGWLSCTCQTLSTEVTTSRSTTVPVGARMPVTVYGCSSCAGPAIASPCEPAIRAPAASPWRRATSEPTTASISPAKSVPLASFAS